MIRRALSLLSAAALAAGLILAGPLTPATAATVRGPLDPQLGTVKGIFTDRSGAPIANASVSAYALTYNGWQRSAYTDARGRYEIDDVPVGPAQVRFDDGTITQYAPGQARQDDARIYTVAPGVATIVDERQVGTGTITGRFTDDDGRPLADASVYVTTSPFRYFAPGATTDDDGRYTFEGVPAGQISLQFVKWPYRVWAPQRNGADNARRYTLRAGRTLTVDETPLPTGALAGVITGADGLPAAIPVSAREVDGDGYYTANAGADGRFSLTVPAGKWRVQLSPHQWVPGQIDQAAAKIFRVAAGETVAVADTLKPTGELQVKLRTGSSHVSQYSFSLWHGGTRVAYENGTNAGSRTFEDLLPGDYLFQYDDVFAPGTLRAEDAVPVKVRPGRTRTLEVTAPAWGTLSGRVTLPSGEPAPGVNVEVFVGPERFHQLHSAVTGTDGEWQITNVFPETYHVRLINSSRELTQDAGDVTVAAGGSATVDSTWRSGTTLTVTAVDATTGEPVTTYCVAVIAKFGDFCTEDSTVTVAGLSPGPTLLTLTPLGDSDHLGRRDVPVTVPAGGTAALSVPLDLGGRINTQVVDRATGEPVSGVCLYAVAPESGGRGDRANGCSTTQGRIISGTLAAGTYQLFVKPKDGSAYGAQWYAPEGGSGDQRLAAKIKVRADKVARIDPILLDRGGSVSGVVRDPAGQPVEHVDVDVSALTIPASELFPQGSDSQGRYTVGNLGPYSWPLVFTPISDLPRQWSGATGNRFQAETVPVISGATSTYDATLSAGAKLTGTVTIAPGDTAWTGGRLRARGVATGDLLAVGDVSGRGGEYAFQVIGDGPVTLEWYLADPLTKSTGWYDGPVRIPAAGRKQLDLTIG